MPKTPRVPHDVVANALLSTNGVVDASGGPAERSDDVWKTVSAKLDYGMTEKYLHIYVTRNTKDILTKLRKAAGYEIEDENTTPSVSHDSDKSEVTSSSSSSSDNEVDDNSDSTETLLFNIHLSFSEWCRICPTSEEEQNSWSKFRKYISLKKNVWANVICDAIVKEIAEVPCAFSMKRSRAFLSQKPYIKFYGKCRDQNCEARISGVIVDKPSEAGSSVPIHITIKSFKNTKHSKKRYLTGEKRQDVGRSLQRKSANVWRAEIATKSMSLYDKEPPNLYSNKVLREAKRQVGHKDLNIPSGSETPIQKLILMKYTSPYLGTIRDIGCDRFFVHYWSPSQKHFYNRFVKKNHCRLCIDATGSLVKNPNKTQNRHGAHIFLYEGVITTDSGTLSVVQMLSERQDSCSIGYWLDMWLRDGAKIPKECVSDYSKAILRGMSKAFNDMSLQAYQMACYQALTTENDTHLPKTYIRVDIAHIINMIRKWKSLQTSPRLVKKFFLHCAGLMIRSTKLDEFENIFKKVVQIACSETIGVNDEGLQSRQEISLNYLLKKISGTPDVQELESITAPESPEQDYDESSEMESAFSDTDEPSRKLSSDVIKDRLNRIFNEAKTDTDVTLIPNPYANPKLAKDFLRLGYDFILWTGVMVNIMGCRLVASSASVEGDFADIKKRILIGEEKPMSVHKFLGIHIRTLEGYTILKSCELRTELKERDEKKEFNEILNLNSGIVVKDIRGKDLNKNGTDSSCNGTDAEEKGEKEEFNNEKKFQVVTSDQTDERLWEEDWRGKGRNKENRRGQYVKFDPNFKKITSLSSVTKSEQITLLEQGSMKAPSSVNGVLYRFDNTCPFDSLLQALAIGRSDYNAIMDDKNTHNLVMELTECMISGEKKKSHNLRAEILHTMHDGVTESNGIKFVNTYTFMKRIIETVIPEYPSLKQYTTCSLCGTSFLTTESVININTNLVLESGVTALQKAVVLPKTHENKKCDFVGCEGYLSSRLVLGDHLFIEVDLLFDKTCAQLARKKPLVLKLNEIPINLKLLDNKYDLAAIINHLPGHFVTYGRRNTGAWEKYDDLKKNVKSSRENIIVTPNILYYVRSKDICT